jgi:cobalt/nickel transport system permease protein
MAFTWCLFFGKIPQPLLAAACVTTGVFIYGAGRHKHTQILPIDVLAQVSRLKHINPILKFWTLLALIVICAASKNPFTGAFLLASMFILAVFAGGLHVRHYIYILALPVSFLMIGGLALLIEVSPDPAGILNLHVFGSWLSVSAKSQAQTALIVSRALGAVSCLCFLSVTTPMPDIIGVLRKIRCPAFIIDLMYLIYRYIFILLSLHHEMLDAAVSRLGFRDYRTGLRATGKIYANLLARSYLFAGKNFDAMESRCYDTGIRFLERRVDIAFTHVFVSVILLFVSSCLNLLPL